MTAEPGRALLGELFGLRGRRALVTGGGSGLGRDIALGLAGAGAAVVVCGRRPGPLEETVAEAEATGGDVRAVPCDLTAEDDVRALGAACGDVDVLVNCAGVSPNQPWTEVSLEAWRSVFAVNVDAAFRLCQLLVPGMVERRWGRVINISSVYGRLGGNPALYPGLDWDVPAYFASKHAVHGITHSLATRVAPYGVTVNSVSPGGFEGSEQNDAAGMASEELLRTWYSVVPMRRRGRRPDIQAVTVFLASAGAAYVTGQDLVVDGGWSVW